MGIKGAFVFILNILAIHFVSAQSKIIENNFIAPLSIPMYLSGSFAELRTNHFHTGIDIKTKGKIGQDVIAIDDGYVVRVKVSPFGYGNALYVKHPNGFTSVYGHLNKFSDRIDLQVKTIQYLNEQFAIDQQFDPKEIEIKKGEVIAESGNSGSSGGPHLHFELRKSASEKPVNPLLFGFDIKDKMRPQIAGIKLIPTNGSLNKLDQAQYFPAVFYDNGFHLKSNPTIQAWGEIGVGIQAFDFLNGDWSKCGIREAELFVDAQAYALVQLDTLSFDELKYINASTDYEERQRNGRWIFKLYKDQPNNHLSNLHPFINRGVLNINEERLYAIKIIVRDSYQNQSEIKFNIFGKPSTIAKKAIPNGWHQFFWNDDNKFNTDSFELSIKSNVLYEDVAFDFTQEQSGNFNSDIFTFGDHKTPLHRTAEVRIRPKHNSSPHDKLFIARLSPSNNLAEALSSNYSDGWVTGKTRQLGKFALLTDTILPEIKALDNITNKNIHHLKSIRFKINDTESGIKKYNGYIDEKWVLFEYDAKNNLLSYYMDAKRLSRNQNHKLKLIVEDLCSNINTYETTFYW